MRTKNIVRKGLKVLCQQKCILTSKETSDNGGVPTITNTEIGTFNCRFETNPKLKQLEQFKSEDFEAMLFIDVLDNQVEIKPDYQAELDDKVYTIIEAKPQPLENGEISHYECLCQ